MGVSRNVHSRSRGFGAMDARAGRSAAAAGTPAGDSHKLPPQIGRHNNNSTDDDHARVF
jgi:hypothetical protein